MAWRSWTARIVAGAAAAAALATSSQAATYIFNVHVTQATGTIGGPPLRPVDFVQTWTFEPKASGSSVEGPGISLRFERANAPTIRTSNEFEPLVRSISGLTLPNAGFSALKSRTVGLVGPPTSGYNINFEATASTTTDAGPIQILRTSSLMMSAAGTTPNNFDPLDQYGVRDLLLYAGPLAWSLEGEMEATKAGMPLFDNRLAYRGFATLIGFEPTPLADPGPGPTPSAAPEPATWALLISGFALAGASLRRGRERVHPA